jgi:hypothetical protein
LESSRNGAQNRKSWILATMAIDKPADHRIKEYDEDGAQCGDEEESLPPLWESLGQAVADDPNEIQEEQAGQTHRGIDLGPTEMLQYVDDNLIGWSAGIESCDAHQGWNLTDSNVDG